MQENKTASEMALAGVKVLELGSLVAGPYASALLAQFGAEVIKIEPPKDGDPLRKWRKLHEGTSLWWYTQSRNKKSVTLDLKRADRKSTRLNSSPFCATPMPSSACKKKHN